MIFLFPKVYLEYDDRRRFCMVIMLDSASLAAIENAIDYYPIEGVTTNPSILEKEGDVPFWEHLESIREVLGRWRSLHVQVVSSSYEEIVKEAELIRRRLGEETYVKIPVTKDGIKAIKHLSHESFHITATAIYNEFQALMALLSGAEYLALYFNRMENNSVDPCAVISSLRKYTDEYGKGRILGASFKNVAQVLSALRSGAHAVTIAPEIISSGLSSSLVENAVLDFRKSWENVHKEKGLIDL